MNRLAGPATRLTIGSRLIARRIGSAAARWVRRGRRHDLTGWRASLGCWARLALLALGGYLLWRLLRAVPNLMWVLTAGWIVASWRAGKPATADAPGKADDTPPASTPETPSPAASREALRTLLLDLMGTGSAVHLSTVLDHLQQRPDTAALTASWKIPDLRARLEALHITVQPKVKAHGKGATRGVRRVDLTPSPGAAPETSTAPSTAA
ncbi:hypothetical protein KVH27_18555 [Streptomyces olivaceus]|uniref:hypothetical protein n=1 Tax=Streptomyces olivaceus TaxID=47716 RepID=UPI001CCDA4DC|nr:hypothetical protein [Streptomyces olivaceus]MBZ6250373.1 hypothetical protein [Streptomyces olivaceus]